MPQTAGSTSRNVADLVRSAAARGRTHVALIDATTGRSRTWGEVDAAVDAEAARLAELGVAPGDRVGVRLPTGPEFCVAVFAVLRAGGVVVPLGPGLPQREVQHIVGDSGAQLVIGSDGVPGTTAVDPPDLATASEQDTQITPVEPIRGGEDLAVLGYTSGTSGRPRGAMLSHRALLANIDQCAALRPAPVTAADRVLLALPLFHVYGLGPGLLQVAAAGATAVLMERFDAAAAVAAIERYRVSTVVGVPPMYQALLELPQQRLREGLATVRLFTSGAAPLDPACLTRMWQAVGLPIHEGYGLTETGPVLTSTLVGGYSKAGSVGRPLPGIELRLVDSDGRPFESVDDDELAEQVGTGLVAVRGANLFSGYWPDGAHGPDAEGWFRTGDVGYLDADGDLHLVDRVGDLIIVNGFNVYPHEVEQVLAELPGVAEAAVVGVPHARTGETVKAVLVPAPAAELTREHVIAFCARRLAKFKVPSVVEFVTSLPRTPTGKLARVRLRQPLGQPLGRQGTDSPAT